MRRRRLLPKPQAPEGGMYLLDPTTGQEVFMSWEELNQTCKELIDAPEWMTGKPYFKRDETYNLRRRK